MWDVGMTQAGSGVSGLSSSSRGFHQSLREGTFGTVPKSSSPEVCSLLVGTRSSFIYLSSGVATGSFEEFKAPKSFFCCLLLSESAGLKDKDRGGRGSCEDTEAPEAHGAPEAPGEGRGGGGGGGGGGDLKGVLGESDLF
ncbi:hypothetical protein Tco_1102430 [Tanacetum coccineum]